MTMKTGLRANLSKVFEGCEAFIGRDRIVVICSDSQSEFFEFSSRKAFLDWMGQRIMTRTKPHKEGDEW